ncbi:hypothetical protein PLESTB_000587600 [Pleodorina starrii]|uniref:Cyclin-like domain-containing protein n=1 Tax=Pleodorina starrii TaxID=330485 RepID=A0A9W6BHH8_9CHLO|nr:hypothetical protein PLESTM_000297200 [Pleodorina starrii]GLC52143.1 hypothetical protein PLESTB_000587600 [Pleodorina starrii]
MRLSMSSASASPDSCSSSGPLSLNGSQSSSCLSLACTETYFNDVDLQDMDALSDDPEELRGSCAGFTRLDCAPQERQTAPTELCRLIREDLSKQWDAQVKPAMVSPGAGAAAAADSAAGTATPRRRLPGQHRALILGWMRQVSSALRLHPSTLFSATTFLDRFVASAEALPADGLLQLLALTCMSVAVKYHEVGQVAPAVWLSLAVDPTGRRLYTPRDLQRYEFTLLQAIDWRLHDPTICTFLEHFLQCLPYSCARHPPADAAHPAAASAVVPPTVLDDPLGNRAAMLAEVSLMYDTFMSYDHSTVALACVALAEGMVRDGAAAAGPHASAAVAAAAAAIAAASGLKVQHIAPGLAPCVDALEKCFAELCQAGALPQPAMPARA